MSSQVGLTLFNLRDHCETEADLDQTLGKVKDIGYQNIQVSGTGTIAPEVIKTLADQHGLNIVASHERGQGLRDDFDGIVKKLKAFDCDFTALGSTSGIFDWKPSSVAGLVDELRTYGERFKQHGIRFGFHNHHQEFQDFGGRTLLQTLYEDIDPDVLYAELDVHWVARGGGNPEQWIRKVDGRMPVIHIKDFTIVNGESKFCEIGEGNLDWDSIFKACRDTKVDYLIVEQDLPFGDRDIFDSMEISYKKLKAVGFN